MFAHLSAPAGQSYRRIRRANVGFSIAAHVLAIAIVWRLPAQTPQIAPHEAAAVIRMLTLPVPAPAPVAKAAEPTPAPRVEPAGEGPETPPVDPTLIPPTDEESAPVLGKVPEPRLALAVGGVNQGATEWPDSLSEMGPVPTLAMYQLFGGNDPPAVLNGREFTQMLGRRYPEILRARGVSGEVRLAFVVDRSGQVEKGSVTVLSYHGEEFVFLTIRYLPMLRFRPALLSGKAVRVRVELPVRWTPLG